MKKIISICMVAVALMLAAPAQAQLIKFGLKGGMNFSQLDFDVNSLEGLNDKSTGFFVGPMAEVTIPVIGLGVDGAVLFSQRGKGEMKKQGLEVPINLKYTIGLGSMFGIYFAAGPDFFFNFKDIDVDDLEVKKNSVAVNLGVGLKLLKKLQLGVNYQIPVGDGFKVKGPEGKEIGETKTWQASLAYIF